MACASAAAQDRDGLGQIKSANGFMQVVADNFDAEISSQNGRKMTHGLAMIITYSKLSSVENITTSTDTIPHMKRLTIEQMKAKNLLLGAVSIQRYSGTKKPDLPDTFGKHTLVSLSMLCQATLSRYKASVKNKGFTNAVIRTKQCPEFGGFNTKLIRDS